MYPAARQQQPSRSRLARPKRPSGSRPSLLELLESRNLFAAVPIGTPGSFGGEGHDISKAFDNDRATYVDLPDARAWVGLDYGQPVQVERFHYMPRPGLAWRMVGGTFQGSNDLSTWTNVVNYGILETPSEGQFSNLPASKLTPFRYFRYLSPSGGYGNVAELDFTLYQPPPPNQTPAAPTNLVSSGGDSSLNLSWSDNANNETAYQVQLSLTPDFSRVLISQNLPPNATTTHFTGYTSGHTYYFRVRAVNFTGPDIFYSDYATTSYYFAPVEDHFRISGLVIGTAGSWQGNGNDKLKALDGDTSTYFDAPTGEAWVGFDLGSQIRLDHVRFFPRAGLAWRMVDGRFEGSNDGATWSTLATINSQPAEGQFTSLSLASVGGQYRYVRYVSAPWGFGNVAELEFYQQTPTDQPLPGQPTDIAVDVAPGSLTYTWADVSHETRYVVELSNTLSFTSGDVQTRTLGANVTSVTFDKLIADNSYYFRIRAENDLGASPYNYHGTSYLTPVTFGDQLIGEPIGTPGSFTNSGNDLTKALDANPNTFFDSHLPQAWVGYDFGAPVAVGRIQFVPRAGLANRMVGGKFQYSNDGTNWTTLSTISSTPVDGQRNTLELGSYTFRYARYLSPEGGYGNIAELLFLPPKPVDGPAQLFGDPIGTPGSWNNSSNDLSKALDDLVDTYFDAPTSQAWVGLDVLYQQRLTEVRFAPRPGLGARMVGGQIQASNDGSTWTTLATITTAPPDGVLTSLRISTTERHRYFRYLSPEGGYGNIAELQFFSDYGIAMP